jgi:hypothetical protein
MLERHFFAGQAIRAEFEIFRKRLINYIYFLQAHTKIFTISTCNLFLADMKIKLLKLTIFLVYWTNSHFPFTNRSMFKSVMPFPDTP